VNSSQKEINDALSNRHWVVCENEVAHSTGPSYIYCIIYLWDKATEFYDKEADIEVLVQILQPAVVARIKAAAASGPAALIVQEKLSFRIVGMR
jgi:hypothetical protein